MSIYSLYYSPTGGTKKVVDVITGVLDVGVGERIDFSIASEDYTKYCFKEEDICLIGVPSFGGRVPGDALEKLRQMQGGGARAILVVVYGNRAIDDTLLELKDEIAKCGFKPCVAISAVAEHSIMRKFATGRPDDKDIKELQAFATKINELVKAGGLKEDVTVPGNFPYREYKGVPFKPSAGKKCRNCGLCATKCPVQAIPKEKPSLTDDKTCISCMRCITVCPEHARGLNRIVLAVASKKMKKVCGERKANELFV